MTGEPFAAAGEPDRDDVVGPAIMRATRFWIDIDPVNLESVDCSRHADTRSRGQIRTSTDAMIQHAIIIRNPLVNEPVR